MTADYKIEIICLDCGNTDKLPARNLQKCEELKQIRKGEKNIISCQYCGGKRLIENK